MTRIVTRDSVDMRLLTMQLHKLQACANAIDSKKSALSPHELAKLFGFLRTDADGKILSVGADYDDEDDDGEI